MKHVHKTVLIWYSPQEMYDLVTAVEDYPSFLPWCDSAQIVQRHDNGVTARLGLSFAGVRNSFTTRNEHVPGRSVVVKLVDGPFSSLAGTWKFLPIKRQAQACKIDFDMRYVFANAPLEALLSPMFDRIANTFVDSFVSRAEAVHGAR
ncbi:MAG: type II toxin-antitoxin system RatA family toxin [Rubrivivax sp.]